MILRFLATATQDDRDGVETALRDLGCRATPQNGTLLLDRALRPEDLVAVSALPGVDELVLAGQKLATVRDVMLDWVAAGALVLGVLTLIASQFPADLGRPADPMFTPGELPPAWPLLPLYAAVERAPAWMPAALFPATAILLMLFWPWIGRGLAARRPGLHTLLGVAGLLLAGGLTVLELIK